MYRWTSRPRYNEPESAVIFPDSKIAKTMKLHETKETYLLEYGIYPKLKQDLHKHLRKWLTP